MEMTDDLLRCQQCIVANIVYRNFDTDRPPLRSIEPQFASRSPGLGFDSFGWFAEQGLLRRVENPRLVTVEGDGEILVAGAIDRTADSLC
ncbi:MAG: hypothetical protein ACE361_25605 [Aureliella sp.]